jgi:hypothetical protein
VNITARVWVNKSCYLSLTKAQMFLDAKSSTKVVYGNKRLSLAVDDTGINNTMCFIWAVWSCPPAGCGSTIV